MGLAFLHGFVLALALILPLGPQNTFVLSQGARSPRWRDPWPVVVAAASADTILIGSAVGGVSLVVLAVPDLRTVLSLAGVVFLVVLGWHSWRDGGEITRTVVREPQTTAGRIRRTLSVSLLNPHAILDTVVVIGGGAALYTAPADKWMYAGAAAFVSWLWFAALSLSGHGLIRLAGPGGMRCLNRVSAVLMWVVGLRVLVELLRRVFGG